MLAPSVAKVISWIMPQTLIGICLVICLSVTLKTLKEQLKQHLTEVCSGIQLTVVDEAIDECS